jgi:GAF domain
MNTPSGNDPDIFQQLLADAFAVQESQINSQSLAAIMEVQRSVASGKLELDGAMSRIVESARNVANATGVAIALLKGDQLTYRAGSGSSADCLGRQVTASLTVSRDSKTLREILRVENAQTDTRIEADICRQFGADALLILPIYQGRALAGIFDVRFSEAHPFLDREVRTYRLMAEQIEAALGLAGRPEPKKIQAAEPSPIPDPVEQIPPGGEKFVPPPEFLMLPANEHSLYARSRAVLADIADLPVCKQAILLASMLPQRAKHFNRSHRTWSNRNWFNRTWFNRTWSSRPRNLNLAAVRDLPVLRQSASLATSFAQRARHLRWSNRRRNSVLAAFAVVLMVTIGLASRHHGPTAPLESSTLPGSTATIPHGLPKPLPGRRLAAAQAISAPSKEARPNLSAFRRVRVSQNEVDYIGDDVTVRLFTDKPAAKRIQRANSRIAHIGSDVTVRYFTPPQPAARTASR